MAETVIVEAAEAAPAVPVVVEIDPPPTETVGEVATAVADAIARADEVDAIQQIAADERLADLERENAALRQSQAFRDGLDAGKEIAPEVIEEPPATVEDDEVVDQRTHAWFRPASEWRRK